MNTEELKFKDVSDKIIGAFYKVYNALGYGFLEKVYERAMMIELKKNGLESQNQYSIHVYYDSQNIGDYIADIIVENKILVELKSTKTLTIQDESQLLNYLSCTKFEVGILLNFGPKPQIKRKAFDNDRKTYICDIREDL
jgi:GxxExxY protein